MTKNGTTVLENEASSELPTTETAQKTPERENWSGKFEFLMSCISVSVGLGNIWRFPFIAYENGGGAFIIPYIIVLFLIGKPMYYMESLLGQFASRSSVKIWSACPAFLGIGIGQAYATTSVISYYASLISITIYYFIASFQSPLPWAYCREEWGSTCVNSAPREDGDPPYLGNDKLQSSSELYFRQTVLRELDDISDGVGVPSWRLVLTLLACYIITFVVVIKGIRSLGKVSYFLALFPYVILITLLVRALTLEGSGDGIIFFLKPDWEQLANMKIWKEAVVQCFFSLSVTSGPIVTFSSHNRFDHNVYRDTMIVTTLDTFTSLLAGITIFGILGNLAYNLQIDDIDDVIQGGTGLAFISYPDAIAKFAAVPQLFAVLFFFMLFVLGIGTIVALQSSVVTVICDQFKFKSFWKVSLGICIVCFSVGLVYVTPGGQWLLNLVDFFAGNFVIFCLAVFEIIGIQWIYGLQNFCDDMEFMLNRKMTFFWRLCWGFLTPVLLTIIFIYTLVIIEPLTYGGATYPLVGDVAGWLLLFIGFAQFPLWATWYYSTHREGSCGKTFTQGLKPSAKWGPAKWENREKWILYKKSCQEQRQLDYGNANFIMQRIYFIFGIKPKQSTTTATTNK